MSNAETMQECAKADKYKVPQQNESEKNKKKWKQEEEEEKKCNASEKCAPSNDKEKWFKINRETNDGAR